MTELPRFRAAHLSPYMQVLHAVGVPVERELRRAHLPTQVEGHLEAHLPLLPVLRMLEQVSRTEGIDALGLRAALQLDLDDLDRHIVSAVYQAPSLKLAIERFSKLCQLENSQLRVWLAADGESDLLASRLDLPDHPEGLQYSEWNQNLALLGVVRAFTHSTWQPSEMAFSATAPIAPFAQEQFPNTRFLRGQGAAWLRLPRELLHRPPRSRSRTAAGDCAADAGVPAAARDMTSALRDVLVAYLREGSPPIELAAELAGTSLRTFQRRLSVEGTTYSELLQELRLQSARTLLEETDLRVMEVALELGYEDASHFSRAFRRMAGVSPRTYRAQLAKAS